ncbi:MULTISPECIES: class I SAM-dependent DNA methyltransferase [Micromonospora]|uniref:class I SAM-dependent DNA methyltransferase n=1 Tax=Micromonospora TaxID=1873 RepID=UPI00064C2B1E|nr:MULTISPECIES: class I SAM-dependent methyltransferase [Micromonospora]MDG4752438.1 class I SAM-dependent methyltransferase [Micromonospora sp. WMMD718]UFN92263.1 class I SAM-dependent methyltransferase [Micromonospora aurantiaca]SCL43599.1 Methyltransferase domain-containing protein [Micromonospora aurantiaca]
MTTSVPAAGMYGEEQAEVYELVHRARGKDYDEEAAFVAEQARALLPGAATLLDVACGTGAHLRAFARLFDRVEGLELSPAMVEAARTNTPGAVVHHGDMRSFHLGERYDVITCMFGSVGYLTDVEELNAALRRFAAHLSPGGVVAIDPWWFPDTYLDGYVSASLVEADGTTVVRVSHSKRDRDASRMEVHYIVARPAGGVHHFVEQHRITLFPRDTYEKAFRGAGLRVRYLEGSQSGRGLFVGCAGHQED